MSLYFHELVNWFCSALLSFFQEWVYNPLLLIYSAVHVLSIPHVTLFFQYLNSKRLDHTIVLVIDTFPHSWIINASPKVIAFTWATGLYKILTINHIRSQKQFLYTFAYYAYGYGMQRCTSNFHSLSVCEVCLGFFSNTV